MQTMEGTSYDDAKRYLLGDIVPAEDSYACFGKYHIRILIRSSRFD